MPTPSRKGWRVQRDVKLVVGHVHRSSNIVRASHSFSGFGFRDGSSFRHSSFTSISIWHHARNPYISFCSRRSRCTCRPLWGWRRWSSDSNSKEENTIGEPSQITRSQIQIERASPPMPCVKFFFPPGDGWTIHRMKGQPRCRTSTIHPGSSSSIQQFSSTIHSNSTMSDCLDEACASSVVDMCPISGNLGNHGNRLIGNSNYHKVCSNFCLC